MQRVILGIFITYNIYCITKTFFALIWHDICGFVLSFAFACFIWSLELLKEVNSIQAMPTSSMCCGLAMISLSNEILFWINDCGRS